MRPCLQTEYYKYIDRFFVGILSILCAIVLILLAILGPLLTDYIHYKTSESGHYLILGTDLANLCFLMPVCILGGILLLRNHPKAKYFLILSSLTLIYLGLSFGIGQEWNHPDLRGIYNVRSYLWMFVILIIGGVVNMIYSLSIFKYSFAPEYKKRTVTGISISMIVFLLLFNLMWILDILSVMKTGDRAAGLYSTAPVMFWTVAYLDLGFTIPFGFIAAYLLLIRPDKLFFVTLLFFGFFIAMSITMNMKSIVQYINDYSELALWKIIIFGLLLVNVCTGFFHFIKPVFILKNQKLKI